jgi:hypothetical protein
MFVRLVISDDRRITLRIGEADPDFMMSLDSQSVIVGPETEIRISKADFEVGLVRFGAQMIISTRYVESSCGDTTDVTSRHSKTKIDILVIFAIFAQLD